MASQCSGEHLALVAQGLRATPDIPVIGVCGDNAQRASFTTAADQQFGVWLLAGAWGTAGPR